MNERRAGDEGQSGEANSQGEPRLGDIWQHAG